MTLHQISERKKEIEKGKLVFNDLMVEVYSEVMEEFSDILKLNEEEKKLVCNVMNKEPWVSLHSCKSKATTDIDDPSGIFHKFSNILEVILNI